MRDMLRVPGAVKSGYLLVEPLTHEARRARAAVARWLRQPSGAQKPSFPSFTHPWHRTLTPSARPPARSKRTVLVNRGWVPPDWRANWAAGAAARQPAGRVAVTGVAQGSEEPSSFVPRNEPAKGNFYYVDVPGIVSCRRGVASDLRRCVPAAGAAAAGGPDACVRLVRLTKRRPQSD